MRFYLDTEFVEDGRTIDLLAIGLVADDGRTYYAESSEADRDRASEWVRENVLPHLEGRGIPREQIRHDLMAFCGDRPEFWAYYGAYDWVAICQLFGAMINLPKGWPFLAYDLRQWLDMRDLSDVRQPDDAPHHALADALWIAEIARKHGA